MRLFTGSSLIEVPSTVGKLSRVCFVDFAFVDGTSGRSQLFIIKQNCFLVLLLKSNPAVFSEARPPFCCEVGPLCISKAYPTHYIRANATGMFDIALRLEEQTREWKQYKRRKRKTLWWSSEMSRLMTSICVGSVCPTTEPVQAENECIDHIGSPTEEPSPRNDL